ncbi:MAG: carboxypeptidase-like regulatory domain-containing protein [Thermoplasmata archaeon]
MSPMRAGFAAWAVAVLFLLAAPAGIGAQAPHTASVGVLAIYQSSYVPEQGNFSVSMEVADAANVHFAYFTFCQLSSPLCYLPVSMAHQGGNWFVGTTKPMSQYNGMIVGVRAGYNITIEYNNNTNVTEPSVPNPFTNLTVAQSVTGEYMYQMTVMNQLYGLSGGVSDAATGRAISGANVTVTPGIGSVRTGTSGGYSFAGIANGSYTLSASAPGYRSTTETLVIDGRNAVQDLALTNATSPVRSSHPTLAGTVATLLTSPIGLGLLAVIVVAVAWVAITRSKSGQKAPRAPPEPPADGGSAPQKPA